MIIVGSWAGGATLAHTLAAAGRSILIPERADFLPREMNNGDPDPVFVQGKHILNDT